MCGICGVVNFDRHEPVDRDILRGMRDTIAYRGPDASGLYVDGAVGLAHRRLSIIDVASGHQPMTNEDGSVCIVFNGEVYNYIELRKAYLEGRHRFESTSDTEVMVHLYEEFGVDCVKLFNGMFAFALWDRRARTLMLARDRVGVKPLYYTVQDGTLVFASEIKALLAHPKVRTRVDASAVDEFITYGYVQSPRTAFEGILRVPEGHVLTWHDGALKTTQYWDVTFVPDERRSEQDHVDRVRELLTDSLKLRLRSDVPLGVLLSGGVDSSAVVAMLSREVGKVKTFSIGFDAGDNYNELHHARRLAEHFDTDHHEMILRPQEFRDFIPRFAHFMDEPVTEAAAIPLYFVCQLTAKHVKVVLSGEGSDELFAGYPAYRRMQILERYRRLPAAARRVVEPILQRALSNSKLARYLDLAGSPLERRYSGGHLYDVRLRDALYRPDFNAEVGDPFAAIAPVYAASRGWDTLGRLLYLDTKTWLPNDILIKADRMSMANSIELRVPFLDYRLIEYAASIPSRYKLRGSTSKYILKRALRGLVPQWILDRKKMGFPTPLALMFRGELHDYVKAVLFDSRADRGYFETREVRRLVDEHVAGRADHHTALWRLLVLEEWHRQFIDQPRTAGLVTA